MTGVLAWGVKQSLISYVSSAPGGQLLTTKDVTWEDGAFRFPLSEPAPASGDGGGDVYDFEGTVRFNGHFGMLVAQLSALRIARGDGGWTLSFTDGEDRVEGFTLDGEPARSGDGDTPRRLDWVNVRITGAGSAVFGDHYPSGTLFDPLTVVIANQ